MSRNPKVVDLELHRHAATLKAIRVSLDGDDQKAVWLPLSLIEIEKEQGRTVWLQVPYDLALDKGLI
jgi:hypothetical protein